MYAKRCVLGALEIVFLPRLLVLWRQLDSDHSGEVSVEEAGELSCFIRGWANIMQTGAWTPAVCKPMVQSCWAIILDTSGIQERLLGHLP